MKNNGIKIRYRIKLHNDFTEPYYFNDKYPICKHISNEEYFVEDEKLFRQIIDDFLDAPKKKLTETKVRKDFNDENRILTDKKVKVILNYYNGRYTIAKKINSTLNKIDINKIEINFPILLKFNIPFEQNYFSCKNDDICDKLIVQNDSYIEIEISRLS